MEKGSTVTVFPSLFSTPWGESLNSSRSSAASARSTSRAVTPAPPVGGGAEQLATIPEGQVSKELLPEKKPSVGGTERASVSSVSSISSVSSSGLPPSLVDKVRYTDQ